MTRVLSLPQRDLLIAHIDGPQPAAVKERATRLYLIDRKFVISSNRDGVARRGAMSIHYTAITDRGREAMAEILAEYAETLVRAGCLDPSAVEISIMPRQDDQLLLDYEPANERERA